MMADRKLFARERIETAEGPPDDAPLGGTRSEAIQRLQIGVVGLFAMVLVMGVASAISSRAQVAENKAVPDAAPTTEPTETPARVDPLADAGVVPVVPKEGEDEVEGGEAAAEKPTIPDIEPDESSGGSSRNNAPDRN